MRGGSFCTTCERIWRGCESAGLIGKRAWDAVVIEQRSSLRLPSAKCRSSLRKLLPVNPHSPVPNSSKDECLTNAARGTRGLGSVVSALGRKSSFDRAILLLNSSRALHHSSVREIDGASPWWIAQISRHDLGDIFLDSFESSNGCATRATDEHFRHS